MLGSGNPSLRAALGRIRLHRGLVLDAAIALILATLAGSFAASDYNPYLGKWDEREFYQRYLARAVITACGVDQGVVVERPGPEVINSTFPALSDIPVLDDFLNLRTESLSCDELPRGRITLVRTHLQRLERYLHLTITLFWRLGGLSWHALEPLFGLFFGLVTGLTYGIFRLGMSRSLAVLGVVAFLPLHLPYLSHFRDYAKAPFFLATILLLGTIATRPLRKGTLYWLSAAAGIIVGLGLGFRHDLMLCIPPFFLALCFLPRSEASLLRPKVMAGLIFLASLGVAYSPILVDRLSNAYSDAGAHHIRQGLGHKFTDELGVRDSLYEWSPKYSDAWPHIQTRVYARFVQKRKEPIGGPLSKEYNEVGVAFLRDVIRQHPADILIRFYASILKLVKFPFLLGIGLLVLGSRNPRLAIFLCLLTAYFTGYPALQFSERHYFHLTFVHLWIFGWSAQWLSFHGLRLARLALSGSERRGWTTEVERFSNWWVESRKRVAFLALGGLVMILVPLYVLRVFQHGALGSGFEEYARADLEKLEMSVDEPAAEVVLVEGFGSAQLVRLPSIWELAVGYLVAEFSAANCSLTSVPITVRYQAGAQHDFSRTLDVKVTPTGHSRIYVPIYSRVTGAYGNSLFEGIELPKHALACLTAMYRIPDLDAFPPLVALNLPADWRRLKRYQTLEERSSWKEFRTSANRIRHRWGRIGQHIRRRPFHRGRDLRNTVTSPLFSGPYRRRGADGRARGSGAIL